MSDAAILIDANEAAEVLSTTRRRVLKLVREGRIPFVDLGDDEPRFSPDELRRWVEEMKRGASDAK